MAGEEICVVSMADPGAGAAWGTAGSDGCPQGWSRRHRGQTGTQGRGEKIMDAFKHAQLL